MRELKSWSGPALAQHIGVSKAALLRWERGALPPLGMLIILSEVLETTLDALLAGRSTEAEALLTPDQRKDAALHLNRLASLLGLRAKK
jgi:transcriptional regulator with XRE-family HTH domain